MPALAGHNISPLGESCSTGSAALFIERYRLVTAKQSPGSVHGQRGYVVILDLV